MQRNAPYVSRYVYTYTYIYIDVYTYIYMLYMYTTGCMQCNSTTQLLPRDYAPFAFFRRVSSQKSVWNDRKCKLYRTFSLACTPLDLFVAHPVSFVTHLFSIVSHLFSFATQLFSFVAHVVSFVLHICSQILHICSRSWHICSRSWHIYSHLKFCHMQKWDVSHESCLMYECVVSPAGMNGVTNE